MKTPPLILNCQRTEVMMSRLGKSGKPSCGGISLMGLIESEPLASR